MASRDAKYRHDIGIQRRCRREHTGVRVILRDDHPRVRKILVPRGPGRYRQRGLLTLTGAGLSPWSIGGGDPHFANVVLLALNENGTDGSTTFDDQSNSNHTLTAVGNAQWDTAQAPSGLTSSGLFDGNGDRITVTSGGTDFDFGTSPFSIEGFLRIAASTQMNIFDADGFGQGFPRSWIIAKYSSAFGPENKLLWAIATGTEYVTTNAISLNTWTHFYVGRDGATLYTALDGIVNTHNVGSGYSIPATGGYNPTIGGQATYGNWYNGHIAAIRVTKGVARYTANFAPPSLPLPTS